MKRKLPGIAERKEKEDKADQRPESKARLGTP